MVTLRHFPGHLEPRATFFSLSEAERIAGVPDDYTAACDVAERFALLAQVVPVSVQAHVLSYMKFRVGPSRLAPEGRRLLRTRPQELFSTARGS